MPKHFKQNVLDLCGPEGEQWLGSLPGMIKETENKWFIRVKTHFANLSCNYVAPCQFSDKTPAVLKILLPLRKPEIFSEEEMLRIWDGNGAVRILRSDKNSRTLLLERCIPGKNLKETFRHHPEKTVEAAIEVAQKLHFQPNPDSRFRSLEDWFQGVERSAGTDFPEKPAKRAREIFEKLFYNSKQKFLIHGDLHHENILSSERELFLAIDPKGITGFPGYEIAVFLNNHAVWLQSEGNLIEILDKTVKRFSEALEILPEELRKWAYAQKVLGAPGGILRITDGIGKKI